MSGAADGATIAIRPAEPGDAQDICRIYNEGIEDRLATLETRLRTPGEQRDWLATRGPRHAVLVAESRDRVVGWASLNAFNPRAAYDHVADFSIYVARDQRGRGIGRVLLEQLTQQAREIGYHKLVLAMFPWNTPGVALYGQMGFRTVGTYREQGMLDGKWVDTLIMEKILR